ncbi:hypothetical protein QC823_13165 [Halomonas vilamensis]|uniref:Uncharacterized protein n=1 Tax=Vreelandella vilamensis TaxID=531309 RepID=A0ABU1H6M9_9GAMM|nr:hypothetical protein [Halomonas vilamensis]MDR5899939.1 hypothetical protein [Halomonas vilamensis]
MSVQRLKRLMMAALVVLLVGGLAACGDDQGPAEEMGESVDESMESAGESMEELGEDIEKAAEE